MEKEARGAEGRRGGVGTEADAVSPWCPDVVEPACALPASLRSLISMPLPLSCCGPNREPIASAKGSESSVVAAKGTKAPADDGTFQGGRNEEDVLRTEDDARRRAPTGCAESTTNEETDCIINDTPPTVTVASRLANDGDDTCVADEFPENASCARVGGTS